MFTVTNGGFYYQQTISERWIAPPASPSHLITPTSLTSAAFQHLHRQHHGLGIQLCLQKLVEIDGRESGAMSLHQRLSPSLSPPDTRPQSQAAALPSAFVGVKQTCPHFTHPHLFRTHSSVRPLLHPIAEHLHGGGEVIYSSLQRADFPSFYQHTHIVLWPVPM